MEFDWRTNDAFKFCHYCGRQVAYGRGWTSVGMCPEHLKIWEEDIASGFKQNRLRNIMVSRGECSEKNFEDV